MGMRNPVSGRMILGSAIHASTAAFDQGFLDNADLTPNDTADVLVDKLRDPGEEVDWSIDDLTINAAEATGLILHGKYCTEISPNYDFLTVEMETKPLEINCGGNIQVTLTGTLDRSRVRRANNGVGISDLKTGATAVQKGAAKVKSHAAQIGTYELLYEHTTGTIITEPGEIIGLKTKGKAEIATGEIIGAKQRLIGTDETPGLIDYAVEMFKSGLFPPNPTSFICGAKYCARWNSCIYHD